MEDRGGGFASRQVDEMSCSLAILDEDTARSTTTIDQEDPSDYFSEWGRRISGTTELLEPHKFVSKALKELCRLYDEFFKSLMLPSHSSISDVSKQNIQAVEQDRQQEIRRQFRIPFFLDKDVERISGGIAQMVTLTSNSVPTQSAIDLRSQALYGSHALIMEVAQVQKELNGDSRN